MIMGGSVSFRQKRPRYGYLSDKIEGIRIVVDLIAVEKCMALKGYWVAEFEISWTIARHKNL
jgi:hypothetical protein